MGCSNVVKLFLASSTNRWLVPLIRPAADCPLSNLKRMTPGGSHTHLPISSQPFFERDYFNRFPLTRRFSRLLQRWAAYPSTAQQMRDGDWVDTPECLTIYSNLSGMKPEKVNVGIRHTDFPGDKFCVDLFISGQADLTFGYVARRRRNCILMYHLPDKIYNYRISDFKVEIGRNSGELKITCPKVKQGRFCFDLDATVIDH